MREGSLGERERIDFEITQPRGNRLQRRLECRANHLRVTVEQVEALVAAALAFTASFWQVSHPTPTPAALYEQVPRWGHVALDFQPRLRLLLQSTAIGLAETVAHARQDTY